MLSLARRNSLPEICSRSDNRVGSIEDKLNSSIPFSRIKSSFTRNIIVYSLLVALTLGPIYALSGCSSENISGIKKVPPVVFKDDFEDGIIDTSLWVVGGGKRCVYDPSGGGSGGWQWFNEEIKGADGYLQARAEGPTSGSTCGGEAWTRTAHDFNDGKDYVINFKWETEILGPIYWDMHAIQITDGFTNWGGNVYDVWAERLGTHNLYQTSQVDTPIQDWSFLINGALNTAELYEGPDGTGTLHASRSLDPSYPWYVRFMAGDATSAGFPGGDVAINLYSVQVTSPQKNNWRE